jgi:serine/threonine protein kinase
MKQKGGALLGKGQYGCAFHPSFKCFNATNAGTDDNQVSKVFNDKESMKDERNEMMRLQNIPALHDYINPVLKSCSVSLETLKKDAHWDKCSFLKTIKSNDTLYQLVYKHKGESLDTYLKNAPIDQSFFKGFLHLLKGTQILNDNKLIHRDAKLPNLLKIQNDKFIFIDFGLACPYNEAYDLTKSDWLLEYNYFIYPPEFQLVAVVFQNIILFHIKKDKKELDSFLKRKEWTKGYVDLYKDLQKITSKPDVMNDKYTQFENYSYKLFDEISNNLKKFLHTANIAEVNEQIQGNNASSLTDMLRTWNRYEVHDIVRKYFENTCAEKVDVFSLGVSLLMAVSPSFHLLSPTVQKHLKNLISQAICFDPTKRITIGRMIEQMNTIVNLYDVSNSSFKVPETPQKNIKSKPFQIASPQSVSPQTKPPQSNASQTKPPQSNASQTKPPQSNASPSLVREAKPSVTKQMNNCMTKYKCSELRDIARENGVPYSKKHKAVLCRDLLRFLEDREARPNIKRGRPCIQN